MSVIFEPITLLFPNSFRDRSRQLAVDEIRGIVTETAHVLFHCTAGLDGCYGRGNARKMRIMDRRLVPDEAFKPVCYGCGNIIYTERSMRSFNLFDVLSDMLGEYDEDVRREVEAAERNRRAMDDFCGGLLPQEKPEPSRRHQAAPRAARPASDSTTSDTAPVVHDSRPRSSHTIGDAIRDQTQSCAEPSQHQSRIRKGGKKDRKNAAAQAEGITK